MDAPDRATVPTCIGCGAMERWGTCETSCSEHRLDLVSAADLDELEADRSAVRARVRSLRPVVEALALAEVGPEGWQAAFRKAQRDARTLLGGCRPEDHADEPADHVTTWWCPQCGGIDAPQPCLGICVWGPADWVSRDVYASVTPREDRWESNRLLLRHQAQGLLRDHPV